MRKLIWALVLIMAQALVGCDRPRQQVTLHQRNAVPEVLSEWHIVEVSNDALSLNARVVPYDLNTALFSDYAHKLRTLWVPEGSSAQYGEENFGYPPGTILSKTSYYPKGADGTVLRTDDYSRDFAGESLDLNRVTLIETRLLVRRTEGWQALPYVWNREQTEAVLEIAGDTQSMQIVDAQGVSSPFTYVVPDANQCAGCHADDHTQKALRPIGPRARHLNKDYSYHSGSENQLAHW